MPAIRKRQYLLLAGLIIFFIIYSSLWLASITIAEADPILLYVARWFAVITMPLFALNLIIAGRYKFLDKLFGYEFLYVIHRYTGRLAFTTALLHGGLMYLAYQQISSERFNELLLSLDLGYNLGKAALALLLIILGITVYTNIKYEYKQLIHKGLGFVLLLGIAHSATVVERGQPESFAEVAYTLTFAPIIFFAVGSYFWRNILRRFSIKQHAFTLDKVEKIATGIHELTLTPQKKPLTYQPGQFAYVRIMHDSISGEPHPFSFTSSPTDKKVSFGIKAIGDYTNEIQEQLKGAKVLIEGAYGSFNFSNGTKEQIWIAGGIGVTPFVSMAKSLDSKIKVTLYYSCTKEEDFAYLKELQKIASKNKKFKVVPWISNQQGRMTVEDILEEKAPQSNTTFFLCGPSSMLNDFETQLKAKGVKKELIFIEHFRML